MTEFILYLGIISFMTIFGMSLISLRNLEKENKKLRKENLELHWKQVKL